jgi:hypothetical protein
MVSMDPRTRRLGWQWWALALLLLAGGVYVAYGYVRSAAEVQAQTSGLPLVRGEGRFRARVAASLRHSIWYS